MSNGTIGRPDNSEIAIHAQGYVEQVPGGDPIQVMEEQIQKTIGLLRPIGDRVATELAYAPGKWTVKQVIGHMSDTERIFMCRALRIARGDRTPLPPFEQDDYVATAFSNERPLEDLLAELEMVRKSTLMFLRGLPNEAWLRQGTVNNGELSVRGIAFTTAGHELHHYKIFQERYLPAFRALRASAS